MVSLVCWGVRPARPRSDGCPPIFHLVFTDHPAFRLVEIDEALGIDRISLFGNIIFDLLGRGDDKRRAFGSPVTRLVRAHSFGVVTDIRFSASPCTPFTLYIFILIYILILIKVRFLVRVLVRSLVRLDGFSAWIVPASFGRSTFSPILYTSIVSVMRIINYRLNRNK